METLPVDRLGTPREVVVPRFQLSVLAGPDLGKIVICETSGEFGIGTEPSNQLVLTDQTVSRTHCTLLTQQDGHMVRDHGSTNGTLVNGTRVVEGYFEPGAVITLGNTQIRVERCAQDVVEAVPLARNYADLLGHSVAMRRLYTALPKIAASDMTVLITGETGTGKGLVSEVIHRQSARAARPFFVLDCGAIAPNLIESELFGHERGAFTGATTARAGAFETAHGGTLFIDELGELPLDLQPKLLRVLESRQLRRIGSNQTIDVDVRVIAATHRDIRQAVNRGTFRADLYFRLNTVCLRMPALRERREDIPQLVQHFYKQLTGSSATEDFVALFSTGDWPGNVRELRSAVERAVLLGDPALWSELSQPAASAPTEGDTFGTDDTFRAAKEKAISHWESWYLGELVRRYNGNLSKAARAVHMDRQYLRELLRKHRIER